MYPDPVCGIENISVPTGTVIEVAGFKPFVVEHDSTTHQVLLDFFRRQHPTSDATDDVVLRCLGEMEKTPEKRTFSHSFYY